MMLRKTRITFQYEKMRGRFNSQVVAHLDTIQDFLCEFSIKPHTLLVETIIFFTLFWPTKIIKKILKDYKILIFK